MKKFPVIDSRDSLDGMLKNLRQTAVVWTTAMLVADEKLHNVNVFLIDEERKIVGGFKPNFDSDSFQELYTSVVSRDKWITTESVQDFGIFRDDYIPKEVKLTSLSKQTIKRILKKLTRPKSSGRKGEISPSTAREVFLQSHMRCMFKGCAKRLDEHSIMGEKGYFGYLAHIIPASENGPRGDEAQPGECALLVDKASNIMLLCDECHRLVDRVAVSDYPRAVLKRMREDYIKSATDCLNQLSYNSAPVAEFLWPVGTNHYGVPSPMEIQRCLSPLKIRWNGKKHAIADKNSNSHDTKTRDFWNTVPRLLELAKKDLETIVADHPVLGLFAGGPMPALIALGALVGNKIKVTPILNSRSSGGWLWLSNEPEGKQFHVQGLDGLTESSEIVLQLNMTNKTVQQEEKRKQLEQKHNCGSIIIEADQMANECIRHHKDALLFQNEMTTILTHLKSSLGIKRVHVLPCASNLICLHFGRSIEQFCPELRIYDFLNDENGDTSIYPVLDIVPTNGGATIHAV